MAAESQEISALPRESLAEVTVGLPLARNGPWADVAAANSRLATGSHSSANPHGSSGEVGPIGPTSIPPNMAAEEPLPPQPFSVESMSGLLAPPRLMTHGGSRTSVIRLHVENLLRPRRLLVSSWPVETRRLASPTAAVLVGTVLKSLAFRMGGTRGRVAQ